MMDTNLICAYSVVNLRMRERIHETNGCRKIIHHSKRDGAIGLYERIEEPNSIGRIHVCLAHAARTDEERTRHVRAAREVWRKIDRPDLIEKLDREFGSADEGN